MDEIGKGKYHIEIGRFYDCRIRELRIFRKFAYLDLLEREQKFWKLDFVYLLKLYVETSLA